MTQSSAAAQSESVPRSLVCRRVAKMETGFSLITCEFKDGEPLTLPRAPGGLIRPSDQLELDVNATDPVREFLRSRPMLGILCGFTTLPLVMRRSPIQTRETNTFLVGSSRRPIGRPAYASPEHRLNGTTSVSATADGPPARTRPSTTCCEPFLRPRSAISDWLSRCDCLNCMPRMLRRPRFRPSSAHSTCSPIPTFGPHHVLLANPNSPAVFPDCGFGSLLAAGELSLDRETSFGRKILSFVPDRRERRFRAPLRKIEFLDGCAIFGMAGARLRSLLIPFHRPFPGLQPGTSGGI